MFDHAIELVVRFDRPVMPLIGDANEHDGADGRLCQFAVPCLVRNWSPIGSEIARQGRKIPYHRLPYVFAPHTRSLKPAARCVNLSGWFQSKLR